MDRFQATQPTGVNRSADAGPGQLFLEGVAVGGRGGSDDAAEMSAEVTGVKVGWCVPTAKTSDATVHVR